MNSLLKRITLLVLDVDGVLTDGTLYFSKDGEEMKAFNSLDGFGIRAFQDAGFKVAVITGRNSPQVRARADNLGIQHVSMGINDKLASLKELLEQTGISPEQAAFIGDDLPDIAPMKYCGASFAPADAAAEVIGVSAFLLSAKGGNGAVREAIELILKAKGKWDGIVSRYS